MINREKEANIGNLKELPLKMMHVTRTVMSFKLDDIATYVTEQRQKLA